MRKFVSDVWGNKLYFIACAAVICWGVWVVWESGI